MSVPRRMIAVLAIHSCLAWGGPDAGVALPAAIQTPSTAGLRFTAASVAGKPVWVSAPMPFEDAERAWRELVARPGIVPVIVSPAEQFEPEERPSRPEQTLPAALATLARKRTAGRDARVASPWAAWERSLRTAAITPEDAEDARELLADDRKHLSIIEQAPVPQVLVVFEASLADVLDQFPQGDSSLPGGRDVAPLFAEWGRRYGARVFEWDGYNWTLDVTAPPTKPADLRALAAAFALACPFPRSGRGVLPADETPGHLLARLSLTRWTCYWFVE